MKIALGADHVGFALKEKVREYLKSQGLEVEDYGPANSERVDYPDFAEKVATQVAAKRADYGVLVCGTGIGMMLAANKVPGIRAVAANDTISARMAREHNNANVLTMGGRMIDAATMRQIVIRGSQPPLPADATSCAWRKSTPSTNAITRRKDYEPLPPFTFTRLARS